MEHLKEIWPNWVIEEKIGEGAYGKVYKIRREEGGYASFAALKIIEFPQNNSEVNELMNSGMDYQSIREYYEDLKQNLINEIRIMESLKTAGNTVSIEDYCFKSHEDSIGWTIYIRMELLESLNDYLQKNGELSKKELLKLGSDICMALKCCEQAHVIHRDIKPDNVFRNPYGDYKLGDFGISKQLEMTKSAYSQKGTSMYMAPEVFRGEHYDHTVDIYSLGIMLYRLANHGRFPFMPPVPEKIRPSDAEDAMRRRMNGEAITIPHDMDVGLGNVIKKACAYRKEERYQKAADFRNALLNLDDADTSQQKNVRQEEQKKNDNKSQGFEDKFEKTYGAWGNEEKAKFSQQAANKENKTHSSEKKWNDLYKPWMKDNDIVEKLEVTHQEAQSGCEKVATLTGGKRYAVMVPAGAGEGKLIRIKGRGNIDNVSGMTGDLYFLITLVADKQEYTSTAESEKKSESPKSKSSAKKKSEGKRQPWMKENDIVEKLKITRTEAESGCEKIKVRQGIRCVVTVPAGVKAGQYVRVKGRGKQGNGSVGDLYFEIIMPQSKQKIVDIIMIVISLLVFGTMAVIATVGIGSPIFLILYVIVAFVLIKRTRKK